MSFADHNYRPLMFLLLESGAVYSLTLTALLVLYKCESWFQYVLVDAVSVALLRRAFQLGHLQFIYADFTHRWPCLLHDYHLRWSRHDQFRRDIAIYRGVSEVIAHDPPTIPSDHTDPGLRVWCRRSQHSWIDYTSEHGRKAGRDA